MSAYDPKRTLGRKVLAFKPCMRHGPYGGHMQRRQFIVLLGGAAMWPLAARAQQAPMPVVGYMSARSADDSARLVAAFRQGLAEAGYVEGRNVAIEYRLGGGSKRSIGCQHGGRSGSSSGDCDRRRTATSGSADGQGGDARRFRSCSDLGSDPVELGLVASLNRPGGNVTGIDFERTCSLRPKRLELLHAVGPDGDRRMPCSSTQPIPNLAETNAKDLRAAARTLGLQIHVLQCEHRTRLRRSFRNLSPTASRRARDRQRCILRTQQQPMPVIGFLNVASPGALRQPIAVFREPEGVRLCRRPECSSRIPLG